MTEHSIYQEERLSDVVSHHKEIKYPHHINVLSLTEGRSVFCVVGSSDANLLMISKVATG